MHKAGFVNILGNPNAGKSTLMNALMGEKLSIITRKAQTTRHRIMGILNGPDHQVVFSDTPGIIRPAYKLHEAMMEAVAEALQDADIFLLVVDVRDRKEPEEPVLEAMKRSGRRIIVVLNKTDLVKQESLFPLAEKWQKEFPGCDVVPVSALKSKNTSRVLELVLKYLPEHPGYFDKEEFTNRSLRFFAAEIVREKIFRYCEKEIPYSSEVAVESYKEEGKMDRISATIFVERDSQKAIMIGRGGSMLKKIGTEARMDLEEFTGRKVFLELSVKTDPDWRDNPGKLKRFGYT